MAKKPVEQLHESVRKKLGDSIPAIADLDQTISTGGPDAAEAQAISDKIDEILAAFRALGLLAS